MAAPLDRGWVLWLEGNLAASVRLSGWLDLHVEQERREGCRSKPLRRRYATTPNDKIEGTTEFLEKRKPKFSGK